VLTEIYVIKKLRITQQSDLTHKSTSYLFTVRNKNFLSFSKRPDGLHCLPSLLV